MNRIEKLLFLDIDGVLNRAEYGKDLYEDTYGDYCVSLHRPSVEALRKLLLDVPDLKIAWITDWAKGNRKAVHNTHCYLNPLIALEQFPWIKERVVGDIWTNANSSSSKIKAIEKFAEDNFVQNYAILDDDEYDVIDVNLDIIKHLVKINPLKSFLEDDLKLVKIALKVPLDGKMMHEALMNCKSFLANKTYRCVFDANAKNPFSDWKKDSNSPRRYAEANVTVTNIETNEVLLGKVTLNDDGSSSQSRYSTMLCVRYANADHWQFWTNIMEIDEINKQ